MKTPRRGFGFLTALTIVLLALFGVVDAEAHLTKYQYGETLSKFIQNSQRAFPPLRLAVVGGLLYLIGHLELGWPL